MDFCAQPIQIDALDAPHYRAKGLRVSVVRTDVIHPQVSGNKWYKLKYALLEAKAKKASRIISFGGAFSNHIHALAYAAHAAQIPCTGFIRGQWRDDNPTLADARRWSMELIALDRARYREKHTPAFIAELEARYPGAVIIPEGGSSAFAVRGAGELMQQISAQSEVDYLLCACGTGGTLAGLISAAPDHLKLIGVPVLKGGDFLKTDIQALLHSAGASGTASWSLDLNGHYGGYAKVKAEHIAHMQRIEQRHGLLLDPVYTAKLWRRFDELVEEGAFAPGSRIALLHSGGLQGRRGFGL